MEKISSSRGCRLRNNHSSTIPKSFCREIELCRNFVADFIKAKDFIVYPSQHYQTVSYVSIPQTSPICALHSENRKQWCTKEKIKKLLMIHRLIIKRLHQRKSTNFAEVQNYNEDFNKKQQKNELMLNLSYSTFLEIG